MLNALLIGDLVGQKAVDLLCQSIPFLRQHYHANVIIANGENAFYGKGISAKQLTQLRSSGVNIVTSGNHIWHQKNRNVVSEFPNYILRPHNYSKQNAGSGIGYIDFKHGSVAVVNLIGRTFMGDPVDNPFDVIENEIKLIRLKTKLILVDFHAESTSEKKAMGRLLDGRISCLVGTHTHVQTADDEILKNGTAYISDLGMSGPHDSIIGMKTETALKRFQSGIPHHYELAENDLRLSGVFVQIDEDTALATHIERFHYKEADLKD